MVRFFYNHTPSFFLICVYAFNDAQDWLTLWNSLRVISASMSTPWIVMSDFTTFLFNITFSKIIDYKNCVQDCSLFNPPSTGLFYS